MIDFSFVYEELKNKYSSTMWRTSEDVIRMFKYLLLKSYFKLSDRDLIERTQTDLLFKYFLGYWLEETKLINPSLLKVATTLFLTNMKRIVKLNEEKNAIFISFLLNWLKNWQLENISKYQFLF